MGRKNNLVQVELAFPFNSASITASGRWAERIPYSLFLWEVWNKLTAKVLFKSVALAAEELRAGVRLGNAWKTHSMSIWGWWLPGLALSLRAWGN